MNPGKPPADPPPKLDNVSAPLHPEDLALAQQILAGDEPSWEAFVERYSGLILAMARRYLHSRDPDDVRTVFVNVLASLRKTGLQTYEGRAALSTWLALVARSEVMDHLRRQFGRDLKMKAWKRLTDDEKIISRLYFIQGLPWNEVVAKLEASASKWNGDRFIAALHRIEKQLGARWLRRLAYDLHAQSIGVASGRLLEYLDHVRDESRQMEGSLSPEYEMMEREARTTLDALRERVASLNPKEQRLLELRFERRWTASRIATELGMSGQRSVYRMVNRIVSRLRRQLMKPGAPRS
jgi:DNA-directed RNA polymerase specialized sigma subunit